MRRKGRKVNTLEAGDFFGEISLVTERPTTATVTLVEPSSGARHLPARVPPAAAREPGVQLQVLEALAERVLD